MHKVEKSYVWIIEEYRCKKLHTESHTIFFSHSQRHT